MKRRLLTGVLCLLVLTANSQESATGQRDLRVMFYNVENLFDFKNDTLKEDEAFLPEGERYWTEDKFYEKIHKTAKVIIATGGWEPPALVGLCEVENRNCLEKLIYSSPLKNLDYRIIHQESPDERGIDVAVLYRRDVFTPLKKRFIEINNPESPDDKTRDIVWVKGMVNRKDSLHIFINHWPSRWGGQLATESKRKFVASVLRETVDSVLHNNPSAKIVIMGDMNDKPDNKSVSDVLNAYSVNNNIRDTALYNLSYRMRERQQGGTLKYDGQWILFDQIIVSGNLLNAQKGLHCKPENAEIFRRDFLLRKDEKNVGYKPYRTFRGYRHVGGFSDHLPVFLDISDR